MKKKTLIIYHRVDFDGLFSAMLYYFKLKQDYKDIPIDLLGYNYGDNLPDLNKLSSEYEGLIMLDISFPPEYMINLVNIFTLDNLTWIDHHITAIRDSINYNYSSIMGVRCEDNSKSACELVWEYCFPSELYEKPKIIKYLSAYDVWNKEKYDWNNEILPCQHGLRAYLGSMNIDNLIQNPELFLSDDFLENQILPGGRMINSYLRMKWKTQVKNSAFDITVAGRLRGIAILSPDFTSAMFESVINKGYQVFCICNPKKDNPGTFSVSLYSEPDGRLNGFELGEYMKKYYRGGGHPTAAGGRLNKEEFENLIFNKCI